MKNAKQGMDSQLLGEWPSSKSFVDPLLVDHYVDISDVQSRYWLGSEYAPRLKNTSCPYSD